METPARAELVATTDHPGGNAHIRAIEGDYVELAPDLRDSTQEWFYWNVTIRAESPGLKTVSFGEHEVVGPRGPAVRRTDGWEWLGADAREDETAFTYDFAVGERVQFALSLPYQLDDFEAAYDSVASHGRLHRETLTTSECGRSVPLLRVGSGDKHVVVTCRHHACESTASYVLEGLLRELLDAGPLSPDYTVHMIPFVDIDGVERGDQGKNRAPHDHNRDYVRGNAISDSLSPIYRSTGAVMTLLERLGEDLVLGLDLHCPFKWGGDNDVPFFVADPETAPASLQRLAGALSRATATRPRGLGYSDAEGTGIHSFRGQSGMTPTFRSFADEVGADLAATLEVPYVGTDSDPVTPESTRSFGRAVASAIGTWGESC